MDEPVQCGSPVLAVESSEMNEQPEQSNKIEEVPAPAPVPEPSSVDEQSNDIEEVPVSAPAPESVDMEEKSNDIEQVPALTPVPELSNVEEMDEQSNAVEEGVQSNAVEEVPTSTPAPEQSDMDEQSDDVNQEGPTSIPPSEVCDMDEKSNDIQEVPPSVPDFEPSDKNGKSDDNNNDNESENNEEVLMEVVKDEECLPARMVIKGFENEDEESPVMTIQEAQDYILKKVESNIKDPNVNPILILNNKILGLQEEMKAKTEELMKLNKVFDSLYKDHVKFLRHVGVMPKVETKTVCVGVDLPWLPETVSGFLQNDLKAKMDGSVQSNNGVTITAVKTKKESGPVECIDLTDDGDVPDPPKSTPVNITDVKNVIISNSPAVSGNPSRTNQHPAPLPSASPPFSLQSTDIPPKPRLKISVDKNGIVLQWDMPPQAKTVKITGFEIFGYQEKSNLPISSSLWKKIGSVNPMPLPMSCTLTQFVEGYKYHFSIRAISNDKLGHFSDPASIMFVPERKKN